MNIFDKIIFDKILKWFTTDRLESVDKKLLENISNEIATTPFLKFMLPNIESTLKQIVLDSKIREENHRVYVTITGSDGSGKTNFTYRILKDLLLAIGLIKQDEVVKIAPHDLITKRPGSKTVSEKLMEVKTQSQDAILIVDGFYERTPNAKEIVALVKELYSSPAHKSTVIVLMGSFKKINSLIEKFELAEIFPTKYRVSFYNPSPQQLAEIFQEYALLEEQYVTDRAKWAVQEYFEKLKSIKQRRYQLHLDNKARFPFRERVFQNASEIQPLYKSVLKITRSNGYIDEQDILECDMYEELGNPE